VLLVTVLVVNEPLNRRQARQRGHAVAAQAAIMVAQAARSARASSAAAGGSGDRGAASDAFRTFMLMLLTAAPVLIDDPAARHFLEQQLILPYRDESPRHQVTKPYPPLCHWRVPNPSPW
jgi:hypothetical protein